MQSLDVVRFASDALWSVRQAMELRRMTAKPSLERRVPGWVQILPSSRSRSQALKAHVWHCGVAIWEAECKVESPDGASVLPADIVYAPNSVVPLVILTAQGIIKLASRPRLIDHAARREAQKRVGQRRRVEK